MSSEGDSQPSAAARVSFCPIEGLLLLYSPVLRDERGFFWEAYRRNAHVEGINFDFVQENKSYSRPNVLRGLHYQLEQPQGKLVRVSHGAVFDVAVDLRQGSPTLGRWFGVHLRAGDGLQLWIPPGFAHGFSVTSPEGAYLDYSLTSYYNAATERTVRWDDSHIGIDWPLQSEDPIVSNKDRLGVTFDEADLFP